MRISSTKQWSEERQKNRLEPRNGKPKTSVNKKNIRTEIGTQWEWKKNMKRAKAKKRHG